MFRAQSTTRDYIWAELGVGLDFSRIMPKQNGLHLSSRNQIFEDSFQVSEEDGGMALGKEQAGTKPHRRVSTRASIHTCNGNAFNICQVRRTSEKNKNKSTTLTF